MKHWFNGLVNGLIIKHFNLWIKTFKYNIKIERIYSVIAKKQRFNLIHMRYILDLKMILKMKNGNIFYWKDLMLCKHGNKNCDTINIINKHE